jgi:autotransporter translocation and assembly factor TamB
MRRLLRWGKWVALVTVVLLIGFVAWLHTSSGRDFLREKAEQALCGQFPGSKVGKVEGSLFGTVVVHDILVQGADGKPLATVGMAEVELGLTSLVSKTLRIDRVTLSDVMIAPRKQPPKPDTPSSSSPSSWSLDLPAIAVHRARIVLPDDEIRDVELVASVHVPASGTLTAIASAKATWRGLAIEAAAYARKDDVLEVPFASVVTGAASATVLGARLGDAPVGELVARISPAVATALEVKGLPSELAAVVHARPGGDVLAYGELGASTLHASGVVDVAKRRGKALIAVVSPDYGAGMIALSGDDQHASGMAGYEITRQGHHVRTLVALTAARTGGWLAADVTSDVGRALAVATVSRKGDEIELKKATVTGHATRLDVVTTDGTHARAGKVELALGATGPVWPQTKVRVDGSVHAEGVGYAETTIASAAARLADVTVGRTGAVGRLHAEANGIASAGSPVGSASLDTRFIAGFDGMLSAFIDNHQVTTAAAGVWAGSGGHVTVDHSTIAVRDIETSSGAGQVTASATMTRDTGDLVADVTAKEVGLATIAPNLGGTASATVHATRKASRWDGKVSFDGRKLTADGKPPVDAHGTVTVAGRSVVANADASNPDVGEVRLTAELDGPADITDARGWKLLERRAIRALGVSIGDAKLAGADPRLSGTLGGDAMITASGAHGALHLHGFQTKAGDVDVDMTLSAAEHGEVATQETVALIGVASANVVVHFALPVHPFDPASWRAHGARVLADGSLYAHDVKFDPDVLARFGVKAPYHGVIDIEAEVAEGATGATVKKVDIRDVAGGTVIQPVSAHFDGSIDEVGAHAHFTAQATAPLPAGELKLLEANADAPLTVDQVRTRDVSGAALTGTIALASLPKPGELTGATLDAAKLLAVIGRQDVSAGTLAGTITLGGTVLAPTATALITTRDLTVPASIEGRPPARLADLVIKGAWDGAILTGDVLGHEGKVGPEGKDGWLHATINGPPTAATLINASFEAHAIDIAPFAAFAPGLLAGARGTLDASLALKGLRQTGDLHGTLQVHKGRLPLHDLIGTMRESELDVAIENHTVKAKLTGKLGRGTSDGAPNVDGNATVALDGASPTKADARLTIRKVSLILTHQPQIDADVTAHLTHSDHWTGKIAIDNPRVLVPSAGGTALLDSAAPLDLKVVDGAPPKVSTLLQRQPPTKPWLVADIALGRTTVDVEDEEYEVKGAVDGHVTLSVGGDGIGLDGAIDAERGDIELLGQRSQLDHGSIVFDGTINPLLDVRVVRDLTDMTVTCEVDGRLSPRPNIRFSSDTGSYSQGDLLAIFLGGQSGDDHSDIGHAAETAGAGLATNLITKKLLKHFPIKLDPHYTPASATTSQAYGLSHWVNEDLYLEARFHPEARLDENTTEGVLEYHINRHMMLSGAAGNNMYDGGDLLWNFHW